VQPERLPHLHTQRLDSRPFQNPRGGGSADRPIPERNPADHAARLLANLDVVTQRLREADVALGRAPGAQGHLVAADAAEGAALVAQSLGDRRRDAVVVLETQDHAVVHFRRDDLTALERKIESYGNPDRRTPTGRPQNEPLVAAIEGFRLPTLADLSDGVLTEDSVDANATYWVELWVRGGQLEPAEERQRTREEVIWLAGQHGVEESRVHSFSAMERDVYLLPLPGEVLFQLPVTLPEAYRVVPASPGLRDLLVADLAPELVQPDTAGPPDADAATVVILDTGVAETHPVLAPAMAAPGVSVVVGEASAVDSHGHGTEMAGLAAFRSLGADLLTDGPVRARAWLENVRMLVGNQVSDDDREFWPERTQNAIEAAEANGASDRIFNLSIGAENLNEADRTSWSIAVDLLAHNASRGRLICVAAGNVLPSGTRADYPALNLVSYIDDPAQAANALTIGAITERALLPDGYGDLDPLAADGELSPFSKCGPGGLSAIKPDIVLEGGNCAPDGDLPMVGIDPLSILTTSHEHAEGRPLTFCWATSCACASGSGLVAETWNANADLRAETVRALAVHSARWTPALAAQFPDRSDLLRAVGYGVADAERAAYSRRTRPTVIVEDELRPAVLEDDGRTYRELHLVRLPLPSDVLLELGDTEIELAVTLSYFLEPNEARRTRYAGANLRWDIQRVAETADDFRRRVNRADRPQGFAPTGTPYPWEIGPDTRSRGSVQSDRCRVSAAELAGDKMIAIFPTLGWWDERPERVGAAIQYGLVVSIDAGDAPVDLYASIEAQLNVEIEID
jgi:hypothetical protein